MRLLMLNVTYERQSVKMANISHVARRVAAHSKDTFLESFQLSLMRLLKHDDSTV